MRTAFVGATTLISLFLAGCAATIDAPLDNTTNLGSTIEPEDAGAVTLLTELPDGDDWDDDECEDLPWGRHCGRITHRVTFGCDAIKPDVCYFSILYKGGGRRNFTLRAGQRDKISGNRIGKDRYMVSINRRPPNEWNDCTTSGVWCKRGYIKKGYNN